MAFDGAGKPYRSGPSWRGALVIILILVVLAAVFMVGLPALLTSR